MNSLGVSRAASLWYPIMLAQERGEISESKGAELLGMNILDYRGHKENAIQAVMRLVNELPSPLTSLVEAIAARPELFETTACASSSNGMETPKGSTQRTAILFRRPNLLLSHERHLKSHYSRSYARTQETDMVRKVVAESQAVAREIADVPITREQSKSLQAMIAHPDNNERLGFFSGALSALHEAGHVVKYADPVVYWKAEAAELLRVESQAVFVRKQ